MDVASSEEDGSDVDEDWKFRVSTQEQFASGGNDIADEFVLAAGFSLTGLTSSAMLSIANVSHTFTTTQSRPATTTRTSAAATTAAAGVTFAQQRPDTTKVVSSLQYYQQRTTDKPVELQSKRVGGAAEPLRITTGAVMTSQPQSAQNSPPYSPKDPMFSHFDEDVIREQHEHRHESPSPTKKQQFRHFPHPSSANNADKLTIATSNATQQPNNMQIYSDIRISPPDKTITREQLYGRGEANVPSGNLQGRPIPTSPGEDAGNILELCKSLPTSLQYGSTSSQPHLQQQQQFGSTPSQQQSYQYISYSQSPGHFDQQQFSSKAAQQSIEQQKLQHHAHVSQSQGQFEQPQQQQQYSYASTSAQSTSDTSKIIYAKSVKPKVKASDSQTNSSQQQLTAVPTVKKSKSKSHSDWSPISDLSPILDVSPSTEQAEAEVNPEEFAKIDGTTITAVVQANGQIIPIGKSQLLKQHQQDQFVSKLKRSPAMILHGSNGNGSGAEVDTSKDSLYAKLTEENQRLRAAVASVAAAAAATNPFLTGPNPFLTDPTTSQLTEVSGI